MPNLTEPIVPSRSLNVPLLIGPTESRSERLRSEGLAVPLPILLSAMIDTGTSESIVARDVVDNLALDPAGERLVYGVASGGSPPMGTVFLVRVYFAVGPASVLASSTRVIAVEDLSRFGVRMLLGRDLLARCLLFYNGPDSRFTFAF
jgi:hypothetical protein